MDGFDLEQGTYRSPDRRLSALARWFPSLRHYWTFIGIVLRSARAAKRGTYGNDEWAASSHEVFRSLEAAGVRISADGLDHVAALDGPCVFVGNHMSMLETMVLPGFIQPLRSVTFVVKESLIHYPIFKYVMRSRDPIVVTRTDPRADLKAMMQGGKSRLSEDRSLIVFPQTTRTTVFDKNEFNSIGVKMAGRSDVPVVPIALRTDAWGNRKRGLKDFGRIDPKIPVHFAFGKPITVEGRGTEAQEQVVAFIEEHLTKWGLPPEAGTNHRTPSGLPRDE